MSVGRTRKLLSTAAFLVLLALTATGLWKTVGSPPPLVALSVAPEGIMGTECRLSVVVTRVESARAAPALVQAEVELRRVEALLSRWIDDSEISRLNRARAGEAVALSDETLGVLRAARALGKQSGGAFDVTCRPLIELWRVAGLRQRLPEQEEIATTLALVGWREISLGEHDAVKRDAEARIDLGGIAKGYGIDRAAVLLEASGLAGGLVDVGGDLRVFGRALDGGAFRVQLKSPSASGNWAEILLEDAAICTSGHYARGETIAGRRFSHIIDPLRGVPVEKTLSVSVVAPTALVADAWATALSVTGPEGIGRIPPGQGIEALVVFGDTARPKAARRGISSGDQDRQRPSLRSISRTGS